MTQEQLQAMTDDQLRLEIAVKVMRGAIVSWNTPDLDYVLDAHKFSDGPMFVKFMSGHLKMHKVPADYDGTWFNPATDISDAWQVVDGFGISWGLQNMWDGRRCSRASVCVPSSPGMSDAVEFVAMCGKGQMPRAICIAALLAMTPTTESR